MSNSCKWLPDAPNGKPSKLFQELQSKIGDRTIAKNVWAFTKTKLFSSEFGDLEKDDNGEYTYDAVASVLNLDSILNEDEKDINIAKDSGILTAAGEPVQFDLANTAFDKAAAFNKKAKSKVALVRETEDGKFEIDVVENTALNIAKADRDTVRAGLNTKLLRLIQKLGFDIGFTDDPSFQSVFNPKNAEDNANIVSTIIRLSATDTGFEDLPEEVSHLVIAGLKNHVLMQRADAAFTDEVVKRVLGDSYKRYYNRYKDGKMPVSDRLREEAQAKVLRDILKGQPTEGLQEKSPSRSIIKKIWEYAKSLFRKANQNDIDNALVEAREAMSGVADLMQRDDFDTVIDRDLILKHEEMFDLIDRTDKLADLAQGGETQLSKRLSILEDTSNSDTSKMRNQIRNIRKNISDEKYEAACYATLRAIGQDMKGLIEEAERLGGLYNNSTDLNVICAESGLVYKMSTSIAGYIPFLEAMTELPALIRRGEIEMSPMWADPIVSLAEEYLEQIRSLKKEVSQMRFSVLKQLISLFHGYNGQMPSTFTETDRYKWESAGMILSEAKEDIRFWDTNLFSAGDSRNPLINVIHNIVVRQQSKRNIRINRYVSKLQEAHAKLNKAGYDDRYVYQLDENGKPTGYYVAPVDMAKFYKEMHEYETLINENEDMSEYDKAAALEKWKDDHMEEVEIQYGDPIDDEGTRRKEWMPKRELYPNPNFQDGWSQEQKDYYKALMDMKANMDYLLPPGVQAELYSAPQVLKSVTQMFDKDGRGAVKTVWNKWKKEFSVTMDYGEYGYEGVSSDDEKKDIQVKTDFNDRIIKRVPVYYVKQLEDLRDLSTDATHAMNCYIAMAVNYSEMGKLADAMRLLQEHVREEYRVVQTRGGRTIKDAFKAMNRRYNQPLTVTGEGSRAVKAILEYIDRNFWNETKNPIGEVKHPFKKGKWISLDTVFNAFMKLVSVSRMGINPLSGMTNYLQGETQIMIEATRGNYFNGKDFAWAKKEYNAILLPYMGDFNSVDRHDKMYMLINQFNSSEDFFRDMRDKDFNKSAFKRLLGRGNVYFCNTMGEHYLHTMGMLMVLKHEKVKRLSDPEGKEVSLYDVIKQVHDNDGWHLELDDDIEFVDKKRSFLNSFGFDDRAIVRKSDRDKLFENLSVYINNINAGMHGGYSEAEKGNMNRIALVRAILQFRQWMFGMYNKLYSKPYYDAVMGVTKDGSYRTAVRWLVGLLHDMKNMTIKEAFEANRLTEEEKRNARIAYAQAGLYLSLALAVMLTAGWKDEDDRALRLLAYNLRRLKLETGALSIVNPLDFVDNVFTLIQSPAAGIKTLENLTQVFDLFTWTQVVHSGRFKGWWKPAKALWVSTPFYNVQKLIDMDDYSYMFNIFN